MIPENEVIPLKKWFAAVLLAALVLTGCGPKQPEAHEAQLFALDTLLSLRCVTLRTDSDGAPIYSFADCALSTI